MVQYILYMEEKPFQPLHLLYMKNPKRKGKERKGKESETITERNKKKKEEK